MTRLTTLLPALALAGCVTPGAAPERTLDAFEQALASEDSATLALAQWCAAHGISSPAQIIARPAPADVSGVQDLTAVHAVLGVGPNEQLGYRHVLLACGDVVLSDAHNWYVPGRLTPEMNAALENTRTPFGTVVAPLGFTRERLAGQRGAADLCPAETILSHRARLVLPNGEAISLVIECYTPANLAR